MTSEPISERPRGTHPDGAARHSDGAAATRQFSAGDITGAHPAPPAADAPAGAGQWVQLQAQFVDDPAAAVRSASGLVEQAVKDLLQHAAPASGSGTGPGTEDLRTAFLRYRDVHRMLTSGRTAGAPGRSGPGPAAQAGAGQTAAQAPVPPPVTTPPPRPAR